MVSEHQYTKDAQKTLRYEQSMKSQGFVRVHPWVKPADRGAVLEYARKLREKGDK